VKTILLVDDESLIALSTKLGLQDAGYRVLVAASGEEAVEAALAEEGPDLVLMDIDLGPGIDGTEAARRILERRRLPIVFLSSHSESSYVAKVRGLTRYGYVSKDAGGFVLLSSIEMAFELFDAHERLRESESRLTTLIKTIPDLVWLKDAEGVYLACNPSFERFFGAPESEIVGKTDYDFLEAELADFFRDKDREAIRAGSQRSNEEWVTFASDGHRALLETIKTPMSDASGKVLGVLGIGRDITERKLAEEALKASEDSVQRKLAAIVEPDGDLGDLGLGDIVDVPSLQALLEDFSALTGMTTAVLDSRGTILVATGWQDICTKFFRKHPLSGAFCTESDLFLAKNLKAGEYLDYRCRNGLWDVVTPLFVDARHVGNIYTGQFFYEEDEVDLAAFAAQAGRYGFDEGEYLAALARVPRYSRAAIARLMDFLVRLTNFVSRLSYSNLKLARATADLRRAEEEKELLLKELQHRVKNSLAIVSSFLRLNKTELLDEAAQRAFQEASDRIKCISLIYEQLDQPTSAGRIRLDLYLSGLAELLRTTYAPDSGRLGVELELPEIECAQKRAVSLGLVFNELFTNALKYACPPGRPGSIGISLRESGGQLELRVADRGPGLPADFDPRTAASLGLRIVHMLAEELGGSIAFESDGGTTAILRFPRD